jgi:hypothetical protein
LNSARDRLVTRASAGERFDGESMEEFGKSAIDPVGLERVDEPHAEFNAVVGVIAPRVGCKQIFALEVEPRERFRLR